MRSRSDAKLRAGRSASSRCRSDSTIPCVSRKRETSVSGGREISFWNVSTVHDTSPFGGPFTVRAFFPEASDFLSACRFSTMCSGACATTLPCVSKPRRPARPAICLKSRTERRPTFVPSNFASFVKSTVRIGMFTPTPSVSVPQTTWRSPFCASCSTRRRYFGRSPAWWTPIPNDRNLRNSLPYGVARRTPAAIFRISSRSSFVPIFTLVSDCASSAHSLCVKFTT